MMPSLRSPNPSCSRWHLHDLLLDGVRHELRFVMDVQLAHEVEFVRLDCLDTEPQNRRDLPHRISFREHLDDLSLARSQS